MNINAVHGRSDLKALAQLHRACARLMPRCCRRSISSGPGYRLLAAALGALAIGAAWLFRAVFGAPKGVFGGFRHGFRPVFACEACV